MLFVSFIFLSGAFARYGRFIWPRFSYHLFQPADCTVSSNESRDNSNEDDEVDENASNVSSTELRDIIEDAKRVIHDKTTEVRNEIEKLQAAERAAAQVFDQVKYTIDENFMDS